MNHKDNMQKIYVDVQGIFWQYEKFYILRLFHSAGCNNNQLDCTVQFAHQ